MRRPRPTLLLTAALGLAVASGCGDDPSGPSSSNSTVSSTTSAPTTTSDDAHHRRPDVGHRRDRHGADERRQLDGEQHDAGRAGLGALRPHHPAVIGQTGGLIGGFPRAEGTDLQLRLTVSSSWIYKYFH